MRSSLDQATAERLLAGRVEPDDAPPGFASVASLLAAASEERQPVTSTVDSMTIEKMASAIAASVARPQPQRKPSAQVRSKFLRVKVVGAVVASTIVGTAGLAMAGALPGSAQGIASSMLARIGVSAPHPNDLGEVPHVSPIGHPAPKGGSGHGSVISGIAHDTTGNKGPTVCQAASDGKCQAGQHGHTADHGHSGQQENQGNQSQGSQHSNGRGNGGGGGNTSGDGGGNTSGDGGGGNTSGDGGGGQGGTSDTGS